MSLAFTFWSLARDRSRLKVESQFVDAHSRFGPARILVKAINKGRRPIYVRMIGGELKSNGWIGELIGPTEFGFRLEEGQYYEHSFTLEDIYGQGPEYSDEFKSIWLEDSLGKRYRVPKSHKYISKLKASNRPI